ncbi:tudor domain-containing protein 5 [Tiliqua scincoides]|uniref:tudor domain-containing protein 5 n=1 Tax=Tiliqua scincoides TaxID=71010 RepID=UPI0034617F19
MSDQERLINLLRKEVRSLLTTIKEGLTPLQLERDYRSMIGEPLPFRALGYQSIMELLVDMPDVVKICRSADGSVILKAIADESTKDIASLVARQKNKPKAQLLKARSNVGGGPVFHSRLPQVPSLPRRGHVPPTLPAVVKNELKELLKSSPVLLSDFEKAFLQRFGRTFEFVRYGFYSMREVLNAASDIITVEQTRAGSLLTLKKRPSPKHPEKLPKCNVMSKRDKTKQTLTTTVPKPAAKTHQTTPQTTEVQSLISSQESTTLILQQELVETPLVRSSARMKQLEKEMKETLVQKGPGETISSELKEKIKTIAAQHPEGLLISKLPGEFEAHFKEVLPVRKLGFLNLMEFVGVLNDILHIECKEGEQDWLIFDIDSQCLADDEPAIDEIHLTGSLIHKSSDEFDEPCWDIRVEESKNLEMKFSVVTKIVTPHLGMEEPRIMQEIMEEEIPPDAVQDKRLYNLPQLGCSALVGLFVEYIVSPSQFYVRIYSAETSEKLEDMMIEMRRCYSSKNVADRYVMPEAFVCPGHLCCTRNSEDKWWYRVIIHRVINDQIVEVFYPDFGNMGIVQKSSLRFLKYCYAKLPAQTIPCALAWVKPTEGDWTICATLEFRRFCGMKLLVGVVDEYIDGVLHLFLCDTSSDEDVYLHNMLRQEGHAQICRENIPSKGFRELNPCNLYLIPSPEQLSGLTAGDASLLQQESLCDLQGTTDSASIEDEIPLQKFAKNHNGLESRKLMQQEECFADSSDSLCVFQEKNVLEDCHHKTLDLEPKELMVSVKDTDPKMPYLEPVYLCTEIWDENLMPSQYLEENENGANLCSDVAVFSSYSQSAEGSKNEAQHSEELVQQTTVSSDATTDSLAMEFYISIAHSQQLVEPRRICLDKGELPTCLSRPLLSSSALELSNKQNGEAPSEKKVDDVTKTQVVALCTTSNYSYRGNTGHNTLSPLRGLEAPRLRPGNLEAGGVSLPLSRRAGPPLPPPGSELHRFDQVASVAAEGPRRFPTLAEGTSPGPSERACPGGEKSSSSRPAGDAA